MTFGSGGIDSFLIDGITSFDPGTSKHQIGRFGDKLSYRTHAKANLIVEPYVGAFYLKNFDNTDQGSLPFGTTPLTTTTTTTAYDNGMQFTAGLLASDGTGKLGAFIQGGMNRSNGLGGEFLSVGARINF